MLTPEAQGLLAGDTPTDDGPKTRDLVNARQQWLNMNAFLARLWALDVADEAFFGLTAMT